MEMKVTKEFKKLVEDENKAFRDYCEVMGLRPTATEWNDEVTERVMNRIELVTVMGGSDEQ